MRRWAHPEVLLTGPLTIASSGGTIEATGQPVCDMLLSTESANIARGPQWQTPALEASRGGRMRG